VVILFPYSVIVPGIGVMTLTLLDFFIVLNDSAALILARGGFSVRIRQASARRPVYALPSPARPGGPCRRDLLGPVAYPLRSPYVQVALPAPLIVNGFAYLANSFTGLLSP
jgi:hypothetical protein